MLRRDVTDRGLTVAVRPPAGQVQSLRGSGWPPSKGIVWIQVRKRRSFPCMRGEGAGVGNFPALMPRPRPAFFAIFLSEVPFGVARSSCFGFSAPSRMYGTFPYAQRMDMPFLSREQRYARDAAAVVEGGGGGRSSRWPIERCLIAVQSLPTFEIASGGRHGQHHDSQP